MSRPDPKICVQDPKICWLASDLTHAIVKKRCRDEVVIELAERLEYVERTGDGSLDGW